MWLYPDLDPLMSEVEIVLRWNLSRLVTASLRLRFDNVDIVLFRGLLESSFESRRTRVSEYEVMVSLLFIVIFYYRACNLHQCSSLT